MTVVLLLCAALLLGIVARGWRRHVETEAWDRELELAFGSYEGREVPRHRIL